MQTLESQVSEPSDWVVVVNNQEANPYNQFVVQHGSLVSLAGVFRHTVQAGKQVVFVDSCGQTSKCLTTVNEVNSWEAEANRD